MPLNVIPKRYSIDHEIISANIDRMCQAIAAADGRSPSTCFATANGPGHWHRLPRQTVALLVAFEQRLVALGF